MVKVGIVGGTGYTGVELLRLLSQHEEAELTVITSRAEAGKPVAEFFPNLQGLEALKFTTPETKTLAQCDVVFCATPNGIAMTMVQELFDAGVKFIDLAADFRFTDEALWSKWYGMEHASSNLLGKAIYGLPEVNRDKIKKAQLLGNPGCYPTAVQLGLLPLLEAKTIDPSSIIADCKSGVSGAGRGASVGTLQAESSENFKAYAITGHRHEPEVEHNLSKIIGQEVNLIFVPHLLPMIRGIHATLYTKLTDSSVDIQKLFETRYQNEPFVDVLPENSTPETRWVKGSNRCKIAIQQKGDTLIILSVIDNLVKGAAGQAVQNMNIMCNLEETMGINQVALMP